jgi:hypothetical protein
VWIPPGSSLVMTRRNRRPIKFVSIPALLMVRVLVHVLRQDLLAMLAVGFRAVRMRYFSTFVGSETPPQRLRELEVTKTS